MVTVYAMTPSGENQQEPGLAHLRAQTEATPDNRLVYPVLAAIDEAAIPLRPGLRGTAQIYGPRVSLGYYLFRRPIALVRQRFGI